MGWIVPSQESRIDLSPVSQNVTIFGVNTFKEVIKLTSGF